MTNNNTLVLPMEMMIEILSRLPVKALMRFKCVRKEWCSLISSDIHFIKKHSCHGPKDATILSHILTVEGLLQSEDNRPMTFLPGQTFLKACNGLLCLTEPLFTDQIILWNPATRMCKVLPDSSANFTTASVNSPAIIYQWPIPKDSLLKKMVSIGFGCNAESDDFKVVRISFLKQKEMTIGVEVYSSKSNSWQIIDDVGMNFSIVYPDNEATVNGNPV